MRVGELLELTQSKKLAIIAKENLDFGEKKAVEALKKAGCYSISGKPGWHFDGDESVLEQSIYDYVPSTKRKAKANVSTNTQKEPSTNNNQPSNVTKIRAKDEIKQTKEQVAPTKETPKERTNVIRKRSSFDMDVELMKDLKIQAIMHDRTVYEIVETAVRQYLKELKK